ncbi:MAG: HD domain-containing protein [Verrucomicrobia bacterium]|nr:HD domain-containing protein [Verrucomicrobiota bacterium]
MDPAPPLVPPRLQATIHIGASSISMLVVSSENPAGTPPETIEFMEQPFPLARDIFRVGKVTRPTTERAVKVLLGFLETLSEFGIGPLELERVVATNILAEASNSDVFQNRLSIACGLSVEILDDGEMTRLIYLKTRRRLLDTPSMRKRTTLVVHVGPGNTRALLFKKGRIERYTSYRLGTHRSGEAVEATHSDGPALLRVIHEHISGQIGQMCFDYQDEIIEDIVVIGYEIQLLNPFLTRGGLRSTLKNLRTLSREAASLSSEERVRAYQLDFHTSEAILPALEINLSIADAFKLTNIRIPDSDYERGLLLDLPVSAALTTGFQAEVVRSAKILARQYEADSKHFNHVAFLAKRLFEETQKLHQLNEHDSLLLEVAAILHEIGGFVSPRSHHKHSQYLIANSEIFGLGRLDVTVVALVARYHRQSGPKSTHTAYRNLPAPDRIRVGKLAAILRVADALERAHSQRVRDISVKCLRSKIHLTLHGVSDAAVERLAMQGKGNIFHDVFGLEVVLVEQGS